MKLLQYLTHLRSLSAKPKPQSATFSRDYTNSNELAFSNELINLVNTASPMEPALDKVRSLCNRDIVSSILQEQLDPHLAFRFFIWTTNFEFLRSRSINSLIIDRLVSSNDDDDSNVNGSVFDLYWNILNELRQGNVPIHADAFRVLISAYWKINKADKAVETFGRMKDFDCKANLYTYNIVLHIMVRKEVILLALAVYNMMLKSNCQPNCSTFNVLIDGLCKTKKTRDALRLFDEMCEIGITPSKLTYTAVLSGLCRAKKVDEAYGLLRTMKSSGCEPDSVAYDVLLNGFCKMGLVDRAISLYGSFREEGYIMGLRGYSCLIDGLVRANRTDEALELFWKLFDFGITPDVVLYTIMIRGLNGMQRLKDAVNLMTDMTGRGLVPDTQCYNSLIKGFCDAGLLDQARSLQLEISQNGCFPDTCTYTILISGMCRHGLVEEAQQIFNEMEKFGCSPSVVTFNALIDGLCKAGKLEEAHLMFYRMEIGKKPSLFLRLSQGADRVLDTVSLQAMVEKMCESGLVLKAYKLLMQLADSVVVPDIYTYNILMNGLCKAKNINGALKLFEQLQLKGHAPDIVTYGTLIDGLQKAGQEQEAFKLFEQMSESGHCFSPEAAYNVLMKRSCRRGKISLALSLWLKYERSLASQDDEALNLVEKRFKEGHIVKSLQGLLERDIKLEKMNPSPYNIILTGLSQARRTEEAFELYSILAEFDVYISPPSCVLLISYLYRERKLDRAMHIFDYTLEKGIHLMPRVCNNLIRSLILSQENAKDAFPLLKRMKSAGYDLNAYLHDGTRALIYRCWRALYSENVSSG